MKVSASIYANRQRPLEEVVKELDQCEVDFFHVDCKDNPGVFGDIEQIRSFSDTPIDLHIISPDPQPYQTGIHRLKVEYVAYQYEDLSEVGQIPERSPAHQGLAITSDTPIAVFDAVRDRCDFLLLMATVPGESGGRFDKVNFDRIRRFQQRFPGVAIHVDGGVNDELSFILRNMGVSAIVSGSYLMNQTSIGAAMLRLRRETVASDFVVGDFMLPLAEVPMVGPEAGFIEALEQIDSFGLGFVVVTGPGGRMLGLITNADVRRGLLRHRDDLHALRLSEITNTQPVTARTDMRVDELLAHIKQQAFPILYLPVVDPGGLIAGAVTFNNLIKGEG